MWNTKYTKQWTLFTDNWLADYNYRRLQYWRMIANNVTRSECISRLTVYAYTFLGFRVSTLSIVVTIVVGWLGSRVVSVLDSGAASTLSGNSLRQAVHTHRAFVHQAAKLVAALLKVTGVTAGLAESNGSLPAAGFMTHVTCRLTAKNRDQLRNPTLGNRVWTTFL